MIGRVNDLLDIFTALVEHLDRQEGQRENREDQDDKVPDTKLLLFTHRSNISPRNTHYEQVNVLARANTGLPRARRKKGIEPLVRLFLDESVVKKCCN